MILPTKHLMLEGSLLGIGAAILGAFDQSASVNELWEKLRGVDGVVSFDRFCEALTFLHILGLVDAEGSTIARRQSP
jgi:hypothetical protein